MPPHFGLIAHVARVLAGKPQVVLASDRPTDGGVRGRFRRAAA